ncbi:MAG: acetylxylan esterase [Terracidiphilus sp.]
MPAQTQTAALQAPASGFSTSKPQAAQDAGAGRAQLNDWLDSLAVRFTAERAKVVAAIQTREEAETRQEFVKKTLRALIGPLPERTALNAKTLGETQADGYRIRKVMFESQPSFPVTALLYVPDGAKFSTRRPAILMTPGHYPTGKAADARMAALFASNGFVVLSYDPIGQGERLQYPDPAHRDESLATAPTGEHGEASLQPMLMGDTFAKYVVWDAMRGVDYLAGLPEVDPHRIGAFGCSGGGTITALTSALDSRIAAIGVACYITSFDALLPSLGPQDAEQSSPRVLSSGLDFPDLVEAAAPRPFAVISTYDDMFPFAGARASVTEARRFYGLFDPTSVGTPGARVSQEPKKMSTEPAWNVDTTNAISPMARLQFITGPGHHGALAPIFDKILSFFLRNLEPGADADHPVFPPSLNLATAGPRSGIEGIASEAFQDTATGQIASSDRKAETVFTLNRKRAAEILSAARASLNPAQLADAVRAETGAVATASESAVLSPATGGPCTLHHGVSVALPCDLAVPKTPGRHPAILFLVPESIHAGDLMAEGSHARFAALAEAGSVVLALTPRPSPPGTEGMKSPILGPFYLLSLRADLVGRTLLGLRIDDVIAAVNSLAARPDVDPGRITAVASGHMGLVLLHAAVLDSRLGHVTIDHVLESYRSLLDATLPIGAPEDVVPGVLLHYDIPNLVRALGRRLEERDALTGQDDLSQTSTPIDSLRKVKE